MVLVQIEIQVGDVLLITAISLGKEIAVVSPKVGHFPQRPVIWACISALSPIAKSSNIHTYYYIWCLYSWNLISNPRSQFEKLFIIVTLHSTMMAMSTTSETIITHKSSDRDFLTPSPAWVWSCLSPSTCPFENVAPTYMEIYQKNCESEIKRRANRGKFSGESYYRSKFGQRCHTCCNNCKSPFNKVSVK